MNPKTITRRRLLQTAAWSAISTVALAACARATPTTAPTKPAAQPTATTAPKATPVPEKRETVTLNFIRPGLGEDAMKEVEAEMKPFYEKYPWIKLEPLIVMPGDLGPKLQTSVAGGAPPDIAMMPFGDYMHYAQSGQLLDLTPLAEKEGLDWKGYYYPAIRDPFVVNGKLYGVGGSGMSPAGLVYNKNIFDEAGISYPGENWMWDDMVTVAQKLTKDKDSDGKIDQWGLVFGTGWEYWSWIWMNGADLFNKDFSEFLVTDPKVIEAFQWLADLRFKHKVLPPTEVLQPYPVPAFMFIDNKVAMSIDHWVPVVSSLYPGMIKNFQWDVAPLPKNPRTGLRITSSSNWATAIFAKTKYPEEAYKIWHWMNSDEGMYARSLGMAGPMMPSGPADKWPMLTKALQEMKTPANAKVFLDALAYSRSDIVPRANAQEIFGAMNPLLEELWLGRKTAAEVAPLIKAAVDPLMKK